MLDGSLAIPVVFSSTFLATSQQRILQFVTKMADNTKFYRFHILPRNLCLGTPPHHKLIQISSIISVALGLCLAQWSVYAPSSPWCMICMLWSNTLQILLQSLLFVLTPDNALNFQFTDIFLYTCFHQHCSFICKWHSLQPCSHTQ